MRKRFTSFILLSIMLLMLVVPGYAVQDKNDHDILVNTDDYVTLDSFSVDEYTLVKNMQSKSNIELLKSGFNLKDIKEFRAFDFKDALIERAKSSDEKLKGMGYDDAQIARIRSIDDFSTEAEVAAASSTVNFSLKYNTSKHGHNSSLSWAVYLVNWSWNSCPLWLGKDIVAIGWSEGFYLTPASQSEYTYCRVHYYDDYGQYFTQYNYSNSVTPFLNQGASITFDQGKNVGGYPTVIWAKAGSMSIKLTKQANVPEMCAQAAYGHTTIAGTPSVTFGVSGTGPNASIGISFNAITQSMATKYVYLVL